MRHLPAVALGASVGAAARWAMSGLGTPGPTLPWGTLLANLAGCAAIGWCAARVGRESIAWSFLVTGLLGGLTTASAFAVEVRSLLDAGRAASAAGYLVASIGGGVALASVSRRFASRPPAAARR